MASVTKGLSAREPFSGSANQTITFTRPMDGLYISNDGAADLTITIRGTTFTVKSGKVFDEYLDEFTVLTITATGAYSGWGRA